ncbi:ion transporter [Longivirga aurantiaca]|uniref:Ion transporter n=1 Tax=Longivirga aurantiaca TaxID=1837743 RepID=A0ABW1SW71_9ACTN
MTSSSASGGDSRRAGRIARLVDSSRFNLAIAAVIVANAVVLGLETYPEVMDSYGGVLVLLNELFFVVFVVELGLRIASYGRRPQDFLRNGWNVFDLVVIGAVLLPGVREQAQLLRLLRLARIVRLVRFLPDARMLVLTVIKSIPAVASMVVLTVLLLFVYGMIGWSLFGAALPETWGTIGRSMLTLFVLLTLENFPTYLAEAEPVSMFAIPFFVSYVLLAAFIVFNLLIGVVISSMEKAREEEDKREQADDAEMLTRLAEVQTALSRLEQDLRGRGRDPVKVSPRGDAADR